MTSESKTSNEATAQSLENERQKWVKSCFQECNKYLAQKGILVNKVLVEQSRYLAPLVALWKVKSQDGQLIWVITGQVPVDHVSAKVSSEPRELLRHFSLTWQMKAQSILNLANNDKVQIDFANLLISRAESLYQLFEDDKLWQ
ncbi:MAG: DUF4826 family protein [Gammaproteobacteria bacterium]|nr:DUF4826 family protein [Gammaproteobacteria bacterium]